MYDRARTGVPAIDIKWKILKQAEPYYIKTDHCVLLATSNSRNELVAAYRCRSKQTLKSLAT